MKNFDPKQCEVTVATNSQAVDLNETLTLFRSVPGLTVKVLNLGYELTGQRKTAKLLGACRNVFVLLTALVRLCLLVWTKRIDIIHSTDRPRDALLSTLLARLTRRKNIIHVHIKWYPEIGRLTNWGLAKCDAVLAISQFVRGSLREGGIPSAKIYTALNATDPQEYDPARHATGVLRARLGLAPETPLLGIVARVILWKGHLELIEALARVRDRFPDVRLAIIGKEFPNTSGSSEDYGTLVRARIAEHNLEENVIWAGWSDEMAANFLDMDVVCVPSWEEPFGLVVTEAMAMEKPVVGFRSGALPEILCHGEEGYLVPPRDTEALAQAIIHLLEYPELRRTIGQRARKRVLQQFTPRQQVEKVMAIYAQVLLGEDAGLESKVS
jgi:glycosyltransferase involved in cell wall biosynthesis